MKKTKLVLVATMLGLTTLAATSAVPAADRPSPPFAGPLRVHPVNPRYFTDDTGRAIYLTGAHTWRTVQDAGTSFPPVAFDFSEFLDLVGKHEHNFIRLWIFESSAWVRPDSTILWLDPLPFERTGPQTAADGRPKFDVTKFNQTFFDRLRSRVVAAGDRSMYVSVMLFQGFSISRKSRRRRFTPWTYHPFHRGNNINRIHGDLNGDGEGYETHELRIPEITRIQETFVRKVVDSVNDLDNVIFEIGNECHGGSTAWQYHMIDVIHRYEQTKPKQHPVWMTFQWDGMEGSGANRDLFESKAEVISPGSASGTSKKAYELDPPAATGRKVVIVDTDHVNPGNLDRADWVWKCFTRGLHPIFMDNPPIRGNDKHPTLADWRPDGPSAKTRAAMGQTLMYARKMDLAAMTPHGDLSNTRYCLAAPGREYLVYQPGAGSFQLRLSAEETTFTVEWFDPKTGKTAKAPSIKASEQATFTPPCSGAAVLYLKAK
jgi:hypothetical protein